MRKIFLSVLIMLFFNNTLAEDGIRVETTVICFPRTVIMQMLKKFGEEPMIFGKNGSSSDIVTGVYLNPLTGTYTILEMNKETGCIISLGQNAIFRLPKTDTM